MLVLKDQEWLQIWRKVIIARVDEPPRKRFKKNGDKSAVVMLKKHEMHDRTVQPVVNRDKSHDRTGQPVVKRDTRHKLNHGPVGCRSSKYTTIGLRLSRHGAAEVDVNLSAELRHAETNPMCQIHASHCTSH